MVDGLQAPLALLRTLCYLTPYTLRGSLKTYREMTSLKISGPGHVLHLTNPATVGVVADERGVQRARP